MSTNNKSDLFKPFEMGPSTLANRIVMAPLTRSRAEQPGDIPGEHNAEYYGQRSTAGLIISEATNISPQGKGYAYTPGIYSGRQVEGWKLVTNTVHSEGGLIFCQLWHVGRVSHPSLQKDNALPVAPSAVKPKQQAFTENGMQDCVTPRALTLEEIPGIIQQYIHAAQCALRAGFDGVEIHAANGYLLQQFLGESTNLRTDIYGGSVENRCRLTVEVTKAVAQVWGADRVGIRFSPVTPANDMHEKNPLPTYLFLAEQLNPLGLAYVHFIEGATGGSRDIDPTFDFKKMRDSFTATYMANNGYSIEMALEAREKNTADLICFGRPFIANPDLVERFELNLPLSPLDPKTLYGGGDKGYTDYAPAIEQAETVWK